MAPLDAGTRTAVDAVAIGSILRLKSINRRQQRPKENRKETRPQCRYEILSWIDDRKGCQPTSEALAGIGSQGCRTIEDEFFTILCMDLTIQRVPGWYVETRDKIPHLVGVSKRFSVKE